MNSYLISRTLLRNEFVKYIDIFDLTAWNKINDIIDNAPVVDISGNEYFPYRTAYFNGVEDARAIARLQGEWIPVSERKPEYSGLYLISIDAVYLCSIESLYQVLRTPTVTFS